MQLINIDSMKFTILLIAFALQLLALRAQNSEKIESDRPSKSQNPNVVPARYFQAEIGYENEKTSDDEREILHPEAVLKYGLFNRIEMRVTIPLASQVNEHEHISESGLQPVHLGFKTLLTKGHNALPQTALTTEVGIPHWSSNHFKADKYSPLIRLSMQNEITEKFSLVYNVGAEWEGDSEGATWLYTFSPQLQLGDKWEVFVETFANLHHLAKPEHSVDAGFGYYLANDVKWDVSAGIGLSSAASKHFYATGLSFRLR
jgi:hypothetical protein